MKENNHHAITPAPPEYLSPYAREEWDRLAPLAASAGTLTEITVRSFELLVEVLGTERRARELINSAGFTVGAGRGGRKPHPALRAMENARTQAAALLKLFRLEPAGAAPPRVEPKPSSTWDGII